MDYLVCFLYFHLKNNHYIVFYKDTQKNLVVNHDNNYLLSTLNDSVSFFWH